MKNYKKIQPLRHIKISSLGQTNSTNMASFDEDRLGIVVDPNLISSEVLENEYSPLLASDSMSSLPMTSYKQFVERTEPTAENPTMGSANANPFKLPKFLNRKDINSPVVNTSSIQDTPKSLPFSKPNFTENPNSFTSVFKKDNDQVSGVKRVFRKSVMFLFLQVVAFLSLIIPILFGLSSNFASGLSSIFSLGWNMGAIILYVVMTSIFYVIVADRSYVWLSLVLQAFFMILSYSLVGMGFNPITLIATGIILILSYFSYLEIEKIQVSSRFFSIGYVTGEAVKILSTIAILILSLSSIF